MEKTRENISFRSETGFSAFFKACYPSLCYFAYQYVKCTADAEDLAVNSFARFWQKRSDFENVRLAKAWLYTATRNAAIDLIRSRKVQHEYRSVKLKAAESGIGQPDEKIIRSEVMQELARLLAKIPAGSGKIVQLCYLQDLDTATVASTLGISRNTVRSQRSSGINALKKLVASANFQSVIGIFLYLFSQSRPS